MEEPDQYYGGWRDQNERDYWVARLKKDGFKTAQAEILVDTQALDLHEVEDALEHGCPLRVAYKIFS